MASILWYRLKLGIAGLLYKPKVDGEVRRYIEDIKNVDLNKNVEDSRIVCIDLETTGLDLRRDHVISIGGIAVRNMALDLKDSIFLLVKYEGEMREENVLIHRITPDLLTEALDLEDALKKFVRFVKNDVVCTFSPIDHLFLDRDLKRVFNVPLLNPVVDVQKVGSRLLLLIHPYYHQVMDVGMLGLEELARRMDIPVVKRHTSLGDAYTTALILISMIKKHKIRDLKQLYSLS
jgi:DNA polymerase-3 subunit epsilon